MAMANNQAWLMETDLRKITLGYLANMLIISKNSKPQDGSPHHALPSIQRPQDIDALLQHFVVSAFQVTSLHDAGEGKEDDY